MQMATDVKSWRLVARPAGPQAILHLPRGLTVPNGADVE